MKSKHFFWFVFLTCFSTTLFAQRYQCGNAQLDAYLRATDPEYAEIVQKNQETIEEALAHYSNTERQIVTIPVVVHIVHHTSAVLNSITDAQVQSQIDVLNRDFAKENSDVTWTPPQFLGRAADTEIRFCLARKDPNGVYTTGIERRLTTTTTFPYPETSTNTVKKFANGGLDPWIQDNYLNIWVYDIPDASSVQGYSYNAAYATISANKWRDGLVVDYKTFGTIGSASNNAALGRNMGRTAVHEIGHYLGLCHLWGCNNDDHCATDNCADTPAQHDNNFALPAPDSHSGGVICTPIDPLNDPSYGDLFMNYMDYTDDKARIMFTTDQKALMHTTISLYRSGLNSNACGIGTSAPATAPRGIYVNEIEQNSAKVHWINSTAISYKVDYRDVTANQTSFYSIPTYENYASLTGLTAGHNYEIKVFNVYSGVSVSSGSLNFTTNGNFSYCGSGPDVSNSRNSALTIPISTNGGVTSSEIFSCIGSSGDVDWFKFTTPSNKTKFRAVLKNLSRDYDMRIYQGLNSTLPVDDPATPLKPFREQEVVINNATLSNTYYIEVKGFRSQDFDPIFGSYTIYIRYNNTNYTSKNDTEEEIEGEPLQLMNSLDIYPNPAQNQITVNFESPKETSGKFSVLNLMGQTVLEQKINTAEGTNTLNLDVSQLSKGVYFVNLVLDQEYYTNKVIIN
jgi:hypothetical protein